MGVWTELNNLPDKQLKIPEEQLVCAIVYGLRDQTFEKAFFGRSEPEQSLERLSNDLRLVEVQEGDEGYSSGDILTSMAGHQQGIGRDPNFFRLMRFAPWSALPDPVP